MLLRQNRSVVKYTSSNLSDEKDNISYHSTFSTKFCTKSANLTAFTFNTFVHNPQEEIFGFYIYWN